MPAFRRTVAALFACALCASTSVAGAQTPDATADLTLVHQPVWHERGDTLGLRLRVQNLSSAPLEGFSLHVALYPRLLTRSDLHGSFDGVSDFEIGSTRIDYLNATLPPEGSDTVSIDERRPTSVALDALVENGVYPLTVSLLDSSGTLLDSLTTELIFYDNRPETPLNLALVVPVTAPPARGPDGVFRAVGDTPSLEEAVLEGGRLQGVVAALAEAHERGLRFALVPNARLLEELADMAGGYRRDAGEETKEVERDSDSARGAADIIADLQSLTGARGVQETLAPYSFADLPSLVERLPDGITHVTSQLRAAEEVISRTLEVDLEGEWLFPPGGRLDRPTLDALKDLGLASFTIFGTEALAGPTDPALAGCPEGSPTFACPVSVETALGNVRGFVSDEGMRDRLADVNRESDTALDLQKLFAETAMIREELPNVEGRIVLTSVPAGLELDPRVSSRLFRGLARAPWLDTVAPMFGLRRAVDPATRSIVEKLPPTRGEPDPLFYSDIAQARDSVESFATIRPPAELIDSFRRNLLVAEARAWWAAPDLIEAGRLYATATQDGVEEELNRLTIVGEDVVTLTSRRGDVQVTVFNNNEYPATLQLDLFSQQLTVDELPVREFAQGATTVQVDVTARSSGGFPLQVSLETPGGEVISGPRLLSIRSTELNLIALAITLGAFGFLVIFYALKVVRGRRRSEATPA